MLENLKIKNFRMLADFQVDKLGNVNLIVGKNNSGKSSVMEALRIYAARANPRVLTNIAASHDEIDAFTRFIDDAENKQEIFPFSDFFSGRHFPIVENDGAIYIGNVERSDYVAIDHTLFEDKRRVAENGEVVGRERVRVDKSQLTMESFNVEQALIVTVQETSMPGWIVLNEIKSQRLMRSNTFFWDRVVKDVPISYVPTQLLSVDHLANLWDAIVFTPYEEDVKAALRILDDNFEGLAFVKTALTEYGNLPPGQRILPRPSADRSARVKLKTYPTSIPLTSMGDGMFRVLQLALAVFPAKGGILLIDEFENGLHWTVQEKIWTWLFKLAHDLNIQVFATTHSDDTVKAFNKVATALPDVGIMIKMVRKPGTDEVIAVVYDEETLQTANLTGTEVR
jgi:predicted ATPase